MKPSEIKAAILAEIEVIEGFKVNYEVNSAMIQGV